MKIKQAPREDATEMLSGSQYLVFQSLLPKLNEVGEWAKELSRWYESDWQLAIEGGRRPVADQVLQSLDEAHRSALKPVFESIDSHYDAIVRQRSRQTRDAGDDATIDLPATKVLPSDAKPTPQMQSAKVSVANETAGIGSERTLDGSAVGAVAEPVNQLDPATMDFSAGFGKSKVSSASAKVRGKTASAVTPSNAMQIPGYRIDGVLGRGGMGVVYMARQLGIDRPVALKMVLSGIHSSRTLLDRFLIEAKAVGKLQHENIVQIYDSGWHQDLPYFSLEYVDGPTLSQQINGEPMDPLEAARIVAPLANAMQYAHSLGVVHRDIKPGNVLMTAAGVPKLADFGLAKQLEDDGDLSRTGDVIGTPGYMAPEQARGENNITGSVDIYGLGGLLYCALTGRPPFMAAKSMDTIIQLLVQEPIPPTRLQPGVPKDLETICLKCLQKEPQKRYATAGDLAADLTRFINGEPIAARPVSKIERAYRWGRRKPQTAALVTTATLSAMILMIGGPIVAGVIYAKKKEVEVAKEAAVDNAIRADKNADEAVANAKLALINEQQASANAKAAEAQGKNAVDALKSLVFEVQRTMRDKPGLQDTRLALLGVAQEGLKRLDGNSLQVKSASIEGAGICRRLGDLNFELGRIEKSRDLYEQCLNNLQELDKNGTLPKSGYRHNFSTAYELLMSSCHRLGRLSEARKYGELSLAQRRLWVTEMPNDEDVRQNLAATIGQLGNLAQDQGDMESARKLLTESEQMRHEYVQRRPGEVEPLTQWIGARRSLAKLTFQEGNRDAAIEQINGIIAEQAKLAKQFPYDISYRGNLAIFRNDLATFQLYADKSTEAISEYELAVEIVRGLVEEDPKNFALREQLGNSLYGLAVAQNVAGLPDESSKTLNECLEIRIAAKDLDPTNLSRQIRWMLTTARAGNLVETIPLASKMKSQLQADAGVYFNLACVYAQFLAAAKRGSELPKDVSADDLANESLALIQKSYELGFRRATDLQMDPDLAPIRGLPNGPATIASLK